MRLVILAAGMVALTACGSGEDTQSKAADDARDIAMVEKAQNMRPPAERLVPEIITESDLEEKDILGGLCAVQHPSGIHYLAIARPDDAWIKLDGELVRLGPDKGSPEQPYGTWTKYDGKEYSLRMQLTANEAEMEPGAGPGEILVRDSFDREVFRLSTQIECKER